MASLYLHTGGISHHLLIAENPSFSLLLSRLGLGSYTVVTMVTILSFHSASEALEFAANYCYRLREIQKI